MFVRVKRISGKEYAYAVENTWKKGRSRQKVKKYLGPVVQARKINTTQFAEWKDVDLEHYIDNTPLKNVMREIVRHTLWQYGFSGRPLQRDGVTIDLRKGPLRGKTSVALSVGEGFLTKDAIRSLIHVQSIDEDRRGAHLAGLFLRAGIDVEKQVFILLYRKVYNI